MPPRNPFLRAIVFAALVALGFVPVVTVAREWLDVTAAASLYLTVSAAAFAFACEASRSRRLGAVVLLVGAGLCATVLADTLQTVVLVLTLALAFARSRVLFAGRLARPWLVEAALGAGAVAAANFVVSPRLGGIAAALWTYWLVQSVYFLWPARAPHAEPAQADPFDAAMRRAADLLDPSL